MKHGRHRANGIGASAESEQINPVAFLEVVHQEP
jgi:hypothetical protein